MSELLIKGIIIGFSIAAPVGPIGILCIRRTLASGRLHGFVSGLGAATADAVYGVIAGLGLAVVMRYLEEHSLWFQLAGGLFLCYLGIRTALAAVVQLSSAAGKSVASLWSDYASTFALTMANPMTIMSFILVFSGLGLSDSEHSAAERLIVVGGVFAGSLAWWTLLAAGVGAMRRGVMQGAGRLWVNRLSGAALLAFGLLALVDLFR